MGGGLYARWEAYGRDSTVITASAQSSIVSHEFNMQYAGIVGVAGNFGYRTHVGVCLRRANYSYCRRQYFFKLYLPMQWSVRSYAWASSKVFVRALLQNGVLSRLQICNRERAGMGLPTLQILDKSVNICSHRA